MMDFEQRLMLITAYAEALENLQLLVGKESELPHSKQEISDALWDELTEPSVPEYRDVVKAGYLKLEAFLPEEEYDIVSKYLEYVGELGSVAPENSIDSEVFRKAAEAIPSTSTEVQRIFSAIEQRIREREQRLNTLG